MLSSAGVRVDPLRAPPVKSEEGEASAEGFKQPSGARIVADGMKATSGAEKQELQIQKAHPTKYEVNVRLAQLFELR